MKQNTHKAPDIISYALVLYSLGIILGVIMFSIVINHAPPEQSKIFMVSFAGVFNLFLLFLGYQIYIGKNLARILFAVFLIYGVVAQAIDPIYSPHKSINYLSYVYYFLALISMILLFLPKSNEWFKMRKEQHLKNNNDAILKNNLTLDRSNVGEKTIGQKIAIGFIVFLLLSALFASLNGGS